MNTVFVLLAVQVLMGAFDNLWHHEWMARLPSRPSARYELTLHAAREALYGVVFVGLAWFEWRGVWAGLLTLLLLAELLITLADFLEEDRTRALPPFERVLHTLLTICYGLFLGFFAPVLIGWASLPSGLVFHAHGWISGLFTAFGVGVLAWSLRNARAVVQLRAGASVGTPADPAADHPSRRDLTPSTVLVTGATGLIGQALVADLRRDGHRVIALSRDGRQARANFGPAVWVVERFSDIPPETRIDAVVHLAGARVLGMPWTPARRQALMASRIGVTTGIVALMRRLHQPPRVLVSASAVGFYGAVPAASCAPLDEAAAPRPGEFQSDLCVAIEHEARRAEALGVRVVRMRFGVVLGHGDGAYPMLALGARWGLGAVLGRGQQVAPWIHLADAVASIRFAIEQGGLSGPVNAVAPDVRPQAQFATLLAASFGRPVMLRVPAWLLRGLLGEMACLLLEGQNAQPVALSSAGFRFRYPGLREAFENLAQAPGQRSAGG